jgi:hypothetical protein
MNNARTRNTASRGRYRVTELIPTPLSARVCALALMDAAEACRDPAGRLRYLVLVKKLLTAAEIDVKL